MKPELVYLAPSYTLGPKWQLAILSKIAAKQALAALYRAQYLGSLPLPRWDWTVIRRKENEYKCALSFLSIMAEEEWRERMHELSMIEIAADSVGFLIDQADVMREWENLMATFGIMPEGVERGD